MDEQKEPEIEHEVDISILVDGIRKVTPEIIEYMKELNAQEDAEFEKFVNDFREKRKGVKLEYRKKPQWER